MRRENDKRFGRREFIGSILKGITGLGGYEMLRELGLATLIEKLPASRCIHALELMSDALNFGPSLFRVTQALAEENNNPAVFRVFYKTSHDIRHELCLTDWGRQYNPLRSLDFGDRGQNLQGLIQPGPPPHSILNAWAHKLLTTGKIDGLMPLSTDLETSPLTQDEIERISVIGAVGVAGGQGIHRQAAVPDVGTLEYAILRAFPDYSPIGSVTIGHSIINAAGEVSSPEANLASFIDSIDTPGNYISSTKSRENILYALDDLVGDKFVRKMRDQMMDTHQLLFNQLQNLRKLQEIGRQTFSNYGSRSLEGLATMVMFADLFKQGLATIGSVGLDSFDFHATDALRLPEANTGNMLTESAQALAGTFYIAKAAFEAQRDAIVHFTTCNNRSENWIEDDQHVSTVTFIIKGSKMSPFRNTASQRLLMPDNAKVVYAEAPGNSLGVYSSLDAKALGLTGQLTIGQVEATLVQAVGQVIGKKSGYALEPKAGKIL